MCSIKEKKIKVLHILVCLGDGGVENVLLTWYKKIPNFIHFDFLVLNKGILDDYFVSNGSCVHYLPRNIAYKPWLHSSYIKELVLNFRYDIVHFHRFAFGGLIMRAMKKCNVSGRIVHSRSTIFQEQSAIKRMLYIPFHLFINRYYLIRYATHILACSNEAGRFLMGPLWGVSHKCIYLPNGASISEFKSLIGSSTREILCNRHRIPLDAIVIGHFGRMEPVKNHKHLLDVFAVLYRRSSKYWLFLGGGGSSE
ncbi:MAG: glycosyltransferase [Desulfomicrobium apsheronum]|nr:glycosyltransferase [Desulfomicrobium apsheronum]